MIQNLCKENPALLNGIELKGKAMLNDGDSFSIAYRIFVFRSAAYAKKRGYPNPFCSDVSNPISDVKISVPKATKNEPKKASTTEKSAKSKSKPGSSKSVKAEVVSNKTVLKAEKPLEIPQAKVSVSLQAKSVDKMEKSQQAKTVLNKEKLMDIPKSKVIELVQSKPSQEPLKIEKTLLLPPKVQIIQTREVPQIKPSQANTRQNKSSQTKEVLPSVMPQIKPSLSNPLQVSTSKEALSLVIPQIKPSQNESLQDQKSAQQNESLQDQKSVPQNSVKTEKVLLVPPKVQIQPQNTQGKSENVQEKQQGSKPSVRLFNTLSACVFNSFHELNRERESMLAAIDRGEKISRNNVLKPYCATLFQRISAYGPIYPGTSGRKREKGNESENPPDKKPKISF